MSSIIEVCNELVRVVRKVEGLEKVDGPRNSFNNYPFAVVFPGSGSWTKATHTSRNGPPTYGGEQSILIDCHVQRAQLDSALARIEHLPDAIPAAIMLDMLETKLGGTTQEVQEIKWLLTTLGWGSVETLGYRFTVTVKLQKDVE